MAVIFISLSDIENGIKHDSPADGKWRAEVRDHLKNAPKLAKRVFQMSAKFSLSFCTCCHCNHNLHFFRLWNVFNFQLVQVVQSVFTFIQFTSHYIPTTRRMTSPYGPPILTWLHSHWWTTWPHVQKDAVKVASWMPPQLIKHDKVPSRLSFQWTKCGESPSLLNKCIMTLFTLVRLAYLRCSFCRPCP